MPPDKLVQLTVISVLGPPGSGKGTQSAALAKTLTDSIDPIRKAMHISVGAMMRNEMNRPGTQYAERIRAAQSTGQLGDKRLTFHILTSIFWRAVADGYDTFVMDGFPRNLERLKLFLDIMSPIQIAIYLKCSEETVMKRLDERGRPDDTAELVKLRVDTFKRETIPVLKEMKKTMGPTGFFEIDAEQTTEVIKAKITEIVTNAGLVGEGDGMELDL